MSVTPGTAALPYPCIIMRQAERHVATYGHMKRWRIHLHYYYALAWMGEPMLSSCQRAAVGFAIWFCLQAEWALQKLQECDDAHVSGTQPLLRSPVQLLIDDIITVDLANLPLVNMQGHSSLPSKSGFGSGTCTGGTHFFLCSTAFSGSACRRIAERLAALPTFEVLVTSRQLPFQPYLQVGAAVMWLCGGLWGEVCRMVTGWW